MSKPRRQALITDSDVVHLENEMVRADKIARHALPREDRDRLFASWEGFTVTHGLRWAQGIEKPADIAMGKAGSCFMNATDLAMSGGFAYVEGFALGKGKVWHHAWCANRDGEVIDNTWQTPERWSYIGVPLVLDAVLATVRRAKRYGVFRASAGLLDGTLRVEDFKAGAHEGYMRGWYAEVKARKLKIGETE